MTIEDEIARDGVFECIRAGGNVKRWHTTQIIGEQTVAAHSWNVMLILHTLFPDCSRELLLAAMYHDVAEKFTGDMPADAKWREPEIKRLLDCVTEGIEGALGVYHRLTSADTRRLAIADRFEMLWFCVEQRRLGNRGVHLVWMRVMDWFNNNSLATLDIGPVNVMLDAVSREYEGVGQNEKRPLHSFDNTIGPIPR